MDAEQPRTPTGPVPNAGQLEQWAREDEQWVAEAGRYDTMLAPFGQAVLAAASLSPGERVADVGCGNGALTIDAARRVGTDGMALGIDISAPMLDLARAGGQRRPVSATSSSCRPTRKCTGSAAEVWTPSSAASGSCSSTTRKRRSPTSPGPCVPVAGPSPGLGSGNPAASPDLSSAGGDIARPLSAEFRVRPLLEDAVEVEVDLLVVEAGEPGDFLALRQRGTVDPDEVFVDCGARIQ
jgi:hypothetical protein